MPTYFRGIPDFKYISRDPKYGTSLDDYVIVKNLFKRGKLRSDIFENLAFFEKYTIEGDDRPDNVAEKLYGDPTLDWVVLQANNILNVFDEWPKTQRAFDKYCSNHVMAALSVFQKFWQKVTVIRMIPKMVVRITNWTFRIYSIFSYKI